MKVVFNNGAIEFPAIRANENYLDISSDSFQKITLEIMLINNDKTFNDIKNFITNNEITIIELFNNSNIKIYSTSEFTECTNIYRNFNEEERNYITISFIKKR